MGYRMPLDAVETLVEKARYPPPKDMQIFSHSRSMSSLNL
jgi:hypothetical protein